ASSGCFAAVRPELPRERANTTTKANPRATQSTICFQRRMAWIRATNVPSQRCLGRTRECGSQYAGRCCDGLSRRALASGVMRQTLPLAWCRSRLECDGPCTTSAQLRSQRWLTTSSKDRHASCCWSPLLRDVPAEQMKEL